MSQETTTAERMVSWEAIGGMSPFGPEFPGSQAGFVSAETGR